ncbi:amino acid ABC transporter permease [Bradyrhizobium sp. 151]|uniref:amino acid ABC transporter permease n=1 Tax=Bradyrhizobium sp. 151 TaxID=2782626 RepID=UPI001FFA8970|nr:amino acid ABC transporter permease [Bradyrhizobium sp. 151]MCK1661983.1 amino acid ABC transporter permease [Bradyrhizobium sp. 151]
MIDILSRFGTSLLIGQFPHGPLGGIALTVVMSAAALLCAFPFAVGIAMARTSPVAAVRRLAAVYVYFVRGVPLLLLIFWAYFVVPLVVGFGTSATITVICALVAYEGAYLGEAIRGALEALPRGQVEASRSLGLGYWSTTTCVVLPQVLVSCLPSMVNQFIILVKDTSLASLVGVHELTFSANQINAQLLTQPLEVYALLAAAYFVLCFALSRLSQFLEGKIARIRSGSRGIAAVAATAEAI